MGRWKVLLEGTETQWTLCPMIHRALVANHEWNRGHLSAGQWHFPQTSHQILGPWEPRLLEVAVFSSLLALSWLALAYEGFRATATLVMGRTQEKVLSSTCLRLPGKHFLRLAALICERISWAESLSGFPFIELLVDCCIIYPFRIAFNWNLANVLTTPDDIF